MYKINSDRILFTQLGDEGIIYDVVANEYLSLNETAFLILSGIDCGQSINEILNQLINAYDINEETCKAELMNVIKQLLNQNIIV